MADALGSWSELARYHPNLQDKSPTSQPPRPAELGPEPASSIASHQSVPILDMLHLARSSEMAPRMCRSNGSGLQFEALQNVSTERIGRTTMHPDP